MNHKNLSKEEWSYIIYGLRKKLNLSQPELSQKLNLKRWAIIRWENKIQKPRKSSIKKVLNFIEDNKLTSDELIDLGKKCINGFSKNMTKPKLNLEYGEELAELIGIILGDGEIQKDSIRISFDPKKDRDFLYRRVFPIINKLLKNKIKYESYKRIAVYNQSFIRFLKENCGFQLGSKSRNNPKIPEWCFGKQKHLSAVLRGLFDTDGYFGYCCGSVEVMYGRFSDCCTNLVSSIKRAMNSLDLYPRIEHTKDGRYKIALLDKPQVLKFFMVVGSSNLKHIVRFLLWKLAKYEAKIEKEGLNKLISKANETVGFEIGKLSLPFYWNKELSSQFQKNITFDASYLESIKIRKLYKWDAVLKELINQVGVRNLAQTFSITPRSIRKWRQGTRIPSSEFIFQIIKLCGEQNIELNKYKNGETNRRVFS